MPSPVPMSTFYYIWQHSNDLQDAAMWGLFLVALLFALAWKASGLIPNLSWRFRARWCYFVEAIMLLALVAMRLPR